MREDNIEIFENTEKLCKTNGMLVAAIKSSCERQKLYLEKNTVAEVEDISITADEKNRFQEKVQIVVSKKRTFEAAGSYNGQSVAVLNFASASNPGGGVVNGSSAQEECLCRCSTLYFNLNEKSNWEKFYLPHRRAANPLHNDDIIYTPDVVVFKSDTAYPRMMKEEEWQKVNVITCAAPNLREKPSNRYNSGDGNVSINIGDSDLQALHEKRVRKILDVAFANKNDVVILGAFGCGAFMNPPEIVARAYKKIIGEYVHAFKTIEFAVYCSPRDESNYQIFRTILG